MQLPSPLMPTWGYAITGICTLLAGLGGVWLTQRGTRLNRRDERWDAHRIEQRQAVIEVVRIGPEWRSALSTMMMIIQNTGNDPGKLAREPVLDDLAARRSEFQRALAAARVIVTEPELRPALDELTRLNTTAVTNWREAVINREHVKTSGLAKLFDETFDSAENALHELETLAAELYSVAPTSRRRRVRGRI